MLKGETVMKIFCRQEIQALEQAGERAGTPLSEMMEQAGRALADTIERRLGGLPGKRAALLCGAGNNGGDGFVCARILAERGAACTVLLVQGEPKTGLARAAFTGMPETVSCLCTQRQEAEEALSAADCVADCIFGFGFRGELAGDAAEFLARANGLDCLRVAADLPSGVECDTARASQNAFRAHVTVAFTAKKPAHCSYPGKEFCGETEVAQVGIPAGLLEKAQTALFETDEGFPREVLQSGGVQANKGDFGRLLLVCGSYGMAGACVMAARAALRCGVGLLHIAIEERAYPIVAQAVPEAIFTVLDFSAPGWQGKLEAALSACTACVIGSGLGERAGTLCPPVFGYFADGAKPLVIDADGLNYCAQNPGILEKLHCPLILTPHPGEMARLLGCTVPQVQADRLALAQGFARKTGAVTVLKGAGTVVASPQATALNPTGNWGMAKGGSGDVLAGMIGSLAAQGVDVFQAAVAGVYLHGLAGDLCRESLSPRAMLPTDLPRFLPQLFRSLLSAAPPHGQGREGAALALPQLSFGES